MWGLGWGGLFRLDAYFVQHHLIKRLSCHHWIAFSFINNWACQCGSISRFFPINFHLISLYCFQLLSCVWLFVTPLTAACQASLSFSISWSLFKLMSIESVMPSNHLILCCPFSSHLQSFPASGSFQMSQLFASGGQSTGVSASASFPPKKSQGWSPSEWTGWISLQSKGLSRVFSNTVLSLLHSPTLTSIHDHRKNHSLD